MNEIIHKNENHQPLPQIEQNKIIKKNKPLRSGLFQRIDFTEDSIGFHGGSQKRAGTQLALWTWLSVAIDTLVMISMSCFFILAFSFLMQTSASVIVKNLFQNLNLIKVSMGSFFISFFIYLVFMRVFNGATLGEWTCSLRLGQPLQRMKSSYILKVSLRTVLIVLTGVVTLPLLSVLFKKDLAGEITGLKIYSLI